MSSEMAAARLKISGGHLRNIEGSYVEPSDRLIYRAVQLYGRTYAELAGSKDNTGDGVPEEPPEQPKNEPKAPPKRGSGGGTGPKRARGEAA